MRFQNLSGQELFINPEEWEEAEDYSVSLRSNDGDACLLEAKNGFVFPVPTEILFVNGIDFSRKKFTLPKSLFKHYCEKVMEKMQSECYRVIQSSFEIVVQKREIVLSKPEYFLLKPPFLTSGGMPGISCRYTLGSLLEVWDDPKYLYEHATGEKLHLVSVAGSFFSGRTLLTCWSDVKKDFITLNNCQLKRDFITESFGSFYERFHELYLRYKEIRINTERSLGNLLKELEIQVKDIR
jgi:hypothetical protein